MLGLICDPVVGLAEVPVKRNAMGASYAFIAADMALAGIESKIPVDEVIDAMQYQLGLVFRTAFRETAEGSDWQQTTPPTITKKEIFGE